MAVSAAPTPAASPTVSTATAEAPVCAVLRATTWSARSCFCLRVLSQAVLSATWALPSVLNAALDSFMTPGAASVLALYNLQKLVLI